MAKKRKQSPKRRKNPAYIVAKPTDIAKHGRKAKRTGIFHTTAELAALKRKVSVTKMKAGVKMPSMRQGETHSQYAKRTKKLRGIIGAAKMRLGPISAKEKAATDKMKKELAKARELQSAGYKIEVKELAAQKASRKLKKAAKKAKKASKKVKKTKKVVKHTAKKGHSMAKKSKKVKKTVKKVKRVKKTKKIKRVKRVKRTAKRKSKKSRAKKASRVIKMAKKGKIIEVRGRGKTHKKSKRTVRLGQNQLVRLIANPIGGVMKGLKSVTNIPVEELAGLAIGGAVYETVNMMFGKIAKLHPVLNTIISKTIGLPVIGPATPNLVMGAAVNMFLNSKYAAKLPSKMRVWGEHVADGMIGAAVVGLGVSAFNKFYKGVGLAGVEYYPMSGGQLGMDADFGGVQYTPTMTGVEYLPGGKGSDFGGIPEGLAGADFEGIPEGLGEGQMG